LAGLLVGRGTDEAPRPVGIAGVGIAGVGIAGVGIAGVGMRPNS
jgi:hypothetical protein